MDFFTLDLYRRFNSSDVDEAVRADADWEDAIGRYKEFLQTFRDDLPPGAKKLAEKVVLHDAEVLWIGSEYLATGFSNYWANLDADPPVRISHPIVSQMADQLVIALRIADEMNVILYSLWDRMGRQSSWARPADDRLYWLYDEIVPDRERPRHFWHKILFSNESTLEIPFIDCVHLTFGVRGERKFPAQV